METARANVASGWKKRGLLGTEPLAEAACSHARCTASIEHSTESVEPTMSGMRRASPEVSGIGSTVDEEGDEASAAIDEEDSLAAYDGDAVEGANMKVRTSKTADSIMRMTPPTVAPMAAEGASSCHSHAMPSRAAVVYPNEKSEDASTCAMMSASTPVKGNKTTPMHACTAGKRGIVLRRTSSGSDGLAGEEEEDEEEDDD